MIDFSPIGTVSAISVTNFSHSAIVQVIRLFKSLEALVATFEAFPPCWKEAWNISVTSLGVAFSRILTRRPPSIADWDFLDVDVLDLARVRGESSSQRPGLSLAWETSASVCVLMSERGTGAQNCLDAVVGERAQNCLGGSRPVGAREGTAKSGGKTGLRMTRAQGGQDRV